ncbi:hypothetical protein DFH29DRAFT_926345 [Suillus ampliporus]|nr:hypothetical protein DFH29DRAFT_926345 [Suillus ampliporus]
MGLGLGLGVGMPYDGCSGRLRHAPDMLIFQVSARWRVAVRFLSLAKGTESEGVRAEAFVVGALCGPAAIVDNECYGRELGMYFYAAGPGEGGSWEKGESEKSLERRRVHCSGRFDLNRGSTTSFAPSHVRSCEEFHVCEMRDTSCHMESVSMKNSTRSTEGGVTKFGVSFFLLRERRCLTGKCCRRVAL